jgi:hypothetical protein
LADRASLQCPSPSNPIHATSAEAAIARKRNRQTLVPLDSLDAGQLLERIRSSDDAGPLVRQLPPETLHRVIHAHGLEACGDLVAVATPAQLAGVFDIDLWQAPQPGRDELFDAGRFGEWLEVLVEQGDAVAARALATMDAHFAVNALAQHVRVFDGAVPAPVAAHGHTIGGYQILAARADTWEAVVCALVALHAEEPDAFHRVMEGCRGLSNAGWELDGLDHLLDPRHQAMFDMAQSRAERRGEHGYVAPAEARAFLQAARETPLPASATPALSASRPSRLAHVQRLMHAAREGDASAYELRGLELAQLANTILVGCSRPLTPPQASQAAMATCNLGLESLLPLPDDFLVTHDLAGAFRLGWATLHAKVARPSAARLLEAVAGLRSSDRDIQSGLVRLRVDLKRALAAGRPWRAREALDIVASLDLIAWNALLALIDELPVLPDAVAGARTTRLTVDPSAFEFVSEHSQIAAVHAFLADLPAALVR